MARRPTILSVAALLSPLALVSSSCQGGACMVQHDVTNLLQLKATRKSGDDDDDDDYKPQSEKQKVEIEDQSLPVTQLKLGSDALEVDSNKHANPVVHREEVFRKPRRAPRLKNKPSKKLKLEEIIQNQLNQPHYQTSQQNSLQKVFQPYPSQPLIVQESDEAFRKRMHWQKQKMGVIAQMQRRLMRSRVWDQESMRFKWGGGKWFKIKHAPKKDFFEEFMTLLNFMRKPENKKCWERYIVYKKQQENMKKKP